VAAAHYVSLYLKNGAYLQTDQRNSGTERYLIDRTTNDYVRMVFNMKVPTICAMLLLLSGCNPDAAMHCVTKRYDSGWSQLVFYNTCNSTINFKLCYKFGMHEIGTLFSGGRAKWHCQTYTARKGRITSIIWSSKQSGLITTVFSASRYTSAACYAPKKPQFIGRSEFKCR